MKKIIKVKILGHNWRIRFVPKKVLDEELGLNAWGFTFSERKCIDICDMFEVEDVERIITHELTHAFICSQGRTYQKKFTQEEVAEFIAWTLEEIKKVKDQIIKERFGKEVEVDE